MERRHRHLPGYRTMKWVTRHRVRVNRTASAWLIRQFIDREATFQVVEPYRVAEVDQATGAIGFDAPGGMRTVFSHPLVEPFPPSDRGWIERNVAASVRHTSPRLPSSGTVHAPHVPWWQVRRSARSVYGRLRRHGIEPQLSSNPGVHQAGRRKSAKQSHAARDPSGGVTEFRVSRAGGFRHCSRAGRCGLPIV